MGYTFLQIVSLWWHGLKQTILFYIPLIKPEKESTVAPSWFLLSFPSWMWYSYLDSDRRPTETFLYNYRYAANVVFQRWLEVLKATAITGATAIVWGWTGGPKYGYPTLSSWLESLRGRIGTWVPYWTTTLANGLESLYLKIPFSIRHGLSSWGDIFDDIKEAVKGWVIERYDQAIRNIDTAWNWIQYTGSVIKSWYDDVGTWVSNLRLNFAAGVLAVLGGVWWRLVTFDKDALEFYYNLWGAYRATLSDFVSDPIGFIYDRVESFLVSKW